MSGKGDTPKGGGQEGVLESVKQAGQSVSSAISNKAGGSQVSLLQTLPSTGSYLLALVDAQLFPRLGMLYKRKSQAPARKSPRSKAQC